MHNEVLRCHDRRFAREAALSLVGDFESALSPARRRIGTIAMWILIVLALILTLALNANSLTIGQQLYKDPILHAAVLAQATSSN